jgi:hypothetical protein
MNEVESTEVVTEEAPAPKAAKGSEASGWLFGTLGWLIPGLGHLVQKRFDRALVFFVSVMAMGVLGLLMGGKLYAPPFEGGQGAFVTLLHLLGFLGDLGAGLLFFFSAAMGMGREYMDRALGDYGTVFFLCAGLLNLLTALDAYDIAVGKKA